MGMGGANGYDVDSRKRSLLQRTTAENFGGSAGSAGGVTTHFRLAQSNSLGSPPPDRPLLGSLADEAEACVTEDRRPKPLNNCLLETAQTTKTESTC